MKKNLSRPGISLVCLVCLVLVSLLGCQSQVVPTSTKHDRIAFLRSDTGEMCTIDSDGQNYKVIGGNKRWPSWSPDGTKIAYDSMDKPKHRNVCIMNADGKNAKCITPTDKICQFPAWSPDGKRIAYCSSRIEAPTSSVAYDIYVINPDGTGITQVTSNAGSTASSLCPKWFPDSQRIAYTENTTGVWRLCSINIDGSGATVYDVHTNAPGGHFSSDLFPTFEVSPDGTKIAFDYAGPSDRRDICVFDINTGKASNLTARSGNDVNRNPTWSPDGTKIAFCGWRLKQASIIYIMNAGGSDVSLLIQGGLFPVWQR